ncbi:MAG: TonB family protein [Spirochaetia bacterium]|nr:TonB family protein [Spirochaetia bacterium]
MLKKSLLSVFLFCVLSSVYAEPIIGKWRLDYSTSQRIDTTKGPSMKSPMDYLSNKYLSELKVTTPDGIKLYEFTEQGVMLVYNQGEERPEIKYHDGRISAAHWRWKLSSLRHQYASNINVYRLNLATMEGLRTRIVFFIGEESMIQNQYYMPEDETYISITTLHYTKVGDNRSDVKHPPIAKDRTNSSVSLAIEGNNSRTLLKSPMPELTTEHTRLLRSRVITTFSFILHPDGKVSSIEVIDGSGNEEVDNEIMNSIRNWRFDQSNTMNTVNGKLRLILRTGNDVYSEGSRIEYGD